MKHLPYDIHPNLNRFHYYETLWKIKALDLLDSIELHSKNPTLLDYGCGRGELLKMASNKGFKVFGLDPDEECVMRAGEFGTVMKFSPPVMPEEIREFTFDVVACLHVLEHVENPIETLLALKKLSSQYLLLAVPNLRTLRNLSKRTVTIEKVNEGHLQSWDHETFLNLAVRHAGLTHLGWSHDATILPFFSQTIRKIFGNKATIKSETTIFRHLFPFHCHSIIGLFQI